MVNKDSTGEKVFSVFNAIFMILIIIVCVYPILYVTFVSVSNSNYMMSHTGLMLFPKGFNLNAYKLVFKNPNIMSGYKNTLLVTIGGTVCNILITSVAAFLISRKNFGLKKFLTIMIVITMYFGGGMIPTYLIINNTLNLGNNLLALILPRLIIPANLFVMRTYFLSIPESLEESAKIDGAKDIVILFKIILPLAMPIMAVMILYYGVEHWNAWFDAMLYIRQRQLYPLQLILREIVLSNSTSSMMTSISTEDSGSVSETIKYATMMIATIPILCVYPFLQKYFVKGMMAGAVKG